MGFDYSAAFDTLNPEILLDDYSSWMEDNSVNLFRSYFTDAKQLVNWNGAYSSTIPVKYGVRQGSVLGPVIFIVYVSRLFDYCLKDLKNASMLGYCDDTSGIAGAKSPVELHEKTDVILARLTAFSAQREIVLNADKTQIMTSSSSIQSFESSGTSILPQKTLDLLGVIFESNGGFTTHNELTAKDLTRRVGAVRRVLPHISRGPLLREIGLALVVGKANYAAWITREARLKRPSSTNTFPQHRGQVALNDLARVITGKLRKDHISIKDLTNKANIPTLNEIIVKRAALEAWKAFNGGILSTQLIRSAQTSRNAANDIVRPKTQSIADRNLANCWNASPQLRSAKTKGEAQRAAAKLASESRFL